MTIMTRWAGPANLSDPHLENEPAPFFGPHRLRISPWLQFGLTVKEVRQPQALPAVAGDSDAAGGGGPGGDLLRHSCPEARVHALVVVHGVPVAVRMKGLDISRVEEDVDGDRMVGVGGSVRIGLPSSGWPLCVMGRRSGSRSPVRCCPPGRCESLSVADFHLGAVIPDGYRAGGRAFAGYSGRERLGKPQQHTLFIVYSVVGGGEYEGLGRFTEVVECDVHAQAVVVGAFRFVL